MEFQATESTPNMQSLTFTQHIVTVSLTPTGLFAQFFWPKNLTQYGLNGSSGIP